MRLEWAKKIQIRARHERRAFYFKQITAIRPGEGEDILGPDTHEFPPAPGPWAEKEAAA